MFLNTPTKPAAIVPGNTSVLKNRISSERSLIPFVETARATAIHYRDTLENFKDFLHPEQAAYEHRLVLESAREPVMIRACQIELARLSDPVAVENARANAKAICWKALEPFRLAMLTLLSEIEQTLLGWMAQSAEEEKQFFAAYDLDRAVTQVTTRFTPLLDEVRQHVENYTKLPWTHSLPPHKSAVLDWFAA
jgi:hypothetical protein